MYTVTYSYKCIVIHRNNSKMMQKYKLVLKTGMRDQEFEVGMLMWLTWCEIPVIFKWQSCHFLCNFFYLLCKDFESNMHYAVWGVSDAWSEHRHKFTTVLESIQMSIFPQPENVITLVCVAVLRTHSTVNTTNSNPVSKYSNHWWQ